MIRIAIQKSGRLTDKALSLLAQAGLEPQRFRGRLTAPCSNYPAEFLFLRDDDIPRYVADGTVDMGIVGENVLAETEDKLGKLPVLNQLGFGSCRLCLALPEPLSSEVQADLGRLNGLKIATSYPRILGQYLKSQNLECQIVTLSGSVEIAPKMNLADGIFDIVSSGETLRANSLSETLQVMKSQAVLVRGPSRSSEVDALINNVVERLNGVLRAASSKYVMLNAPKDKIDDIKSLLPGVQGPTITQLAGREDWVAVHAVTQESVLWETMEKLRSNGATSILVLPIEKMIE